MQIPAGLEHVLSIDPEIMHGELCFKGTRVPLNIWLDNATDGMGVDEFLKYYPSISRDQVDAVIQWEHNQIREASGIN